MKIKIILILLVIAFSLQFAKSQDLYVKAFGKLENKSKTILYLHGGPGYNCVNFEISTAQKLADEGYYVICYDRRGEGRSQGGAKFTFEEAIQDINSILEKEKIERVTLFGHSFGGMLGVKFSEKHPSKVSNLVLIGAPINLQESFKHIISSVKQIYTNNNDRTNLNYIDMLEKMDTTKMEYASYCFMHAMQNKFYTPKKPNAEANAIYKLLFADSTFKKYASKMTYDAPKQFSLNEQYTTLDLTQNISNLRATNINVIGIYGKDDGLYSEKQIENLKKIINEKSMYYLDNTSHNVFVDSQTEFINIIKQNLTIW